MKAFIVALKEGERLKRKKEVEEIHVNIAGGRKTMSGVLTALSNIFSVDAVYHLLTTAEVEQQGNIKNFLTAQNKLDVEKLNSASLKANLHPKTVDAPSTLVELPILHPIEFEELTELAEKIRKGEEISEDKLINQLKKQKYIRDIGQKRYRPTEKGENLFNLFDFYDED